MTIRLTAEEARKAGLNPVKRKRCQKKPRKGTTFGKLTPSRAVLFKAACAAHGLPEPTPEFLFDTRRKWRFDWAWCGPLVALEIDGGAWTAGRHTRGKGFIEDQAKLNEALLFGWRVLRCTPQDVESGAVFTLLKRALL